MFNIYEESGYLDMNRIINLPTPFIFMIGGRGIGKSYGAIKYVIDNDIKFMLSRRTQTQADLIGVPEFSPLKPVCDDMGIMYDIKPIIKQCSGIYLTDPKTEEHELIGFTSALSTLSNIRGFDSSEIKVWIYDEFIPERHERTLRFEGDGFLNAYETINRNRELKGQPALKAICISNSNDIVSPVLDVLNLVPIVEKMQNKKQEVYINYNRGITIILPHDSPISEMKKDTALYRAVSAESRFVKMALGNEFENETCIESKNLSEYKLLVSVGDIHIYHHKSNYTYYISRHKTGTAPKYGTDPTSKIQFRAAYRQLQSAYITGKISFENINIKRQFEEIFLIKY